MTKTRSADDLISQVEQQKLNPNAPPPPPIEEVSHVEEAPEVEAVEAEEKPVEEKKLATKEAIEEKAEDAETIDDYGNKTAKPKMYTQEEVERMMRDRLKRAHTNQQTEQQTAQQATDLAKDFTPDANSEEAWEQQLERFVDKRVESKLSRHEKDLQDKEWRAKQEKIQEDFELKFNAGMKRYDDFRDVVTQAPLTDSMVLATRTLEDPAAFLYAASKTQQTELQRIAQIPDALQQAAAIGQLEARMRKNKASSSKVSKPLQKVKGDMPDGGKYQRTSIDARIHEYGKQKRSR